MQDSCPQKANANIAVSQMKADIKCVEATSKYVIGNVLINVSNDVLQHIPKQSSLARTLMRHREESHFPIPTTTNSDIPEKCIHLNLGTIMNDAAIESSPKTTNCWEGFHNGLNALFHGCHPSICSSFDGLEKDISFHRLTSTKAKALMGQPERIKSKHAQLDEQVALAVQGYANNFDKLVYLYRMANLQAMEIQFQKNTLLQ